MQSTFLVLTHITGNQIFFPVLCSKEHGPEVKQSFMNLGTVPVFHQSLFNLFPTSASCPWEERKYSLALVSGGLGMLSQGDDQIFYKLYVESTKIPKVQKYQK